LLSLLHPMGVRGESSGGQWAYAARAAAGRWVGSVGVGSGSRSARWFHLEQAPLVGH